MKATSLRDVVFLMVLMYYLPLYATLSAPADQQAKVGENITFKCNVSVKSLLTTLKYSKNRSFERSKRIVYRTSQKPLTIERLFKDRVHVEPSGLLVLQNAQIRDGGFYKCFTELIDGRERLHEVKLFVGAPPVIEPFPTSGIAILEGNHLKAFCNVSGYPAPDVFWYRTNSLTGRGRIVANRSILEIRSVEQSHSGQYNCYASNNMGQATRTVRVQVYEKPTVSEFYNTASLSGSIYECEAVSFRCEALGNKPRVRRFHFYRNGHLLIKGSRTGSFTISKVREKHQGQYSCTPENKLGLGLNRTVDLKVVAAPFNCKENFSIPINENNTVETTDFTGEYPTPSGKSSSYETLGHQSQYSVCLTVMLLAIYSVGTSCL